MPKLFGLDIAGIVAGALAEAGGLIEGTLTKFTPGTRTPGSLTGGTNPTTTTHTFQGFIQERTEEQQDGSLVVVGGRQIVIIGATIDPPVVPQPQDKINIEDENYVIADDGVNRDPAAATYTCEVER